MGKHGFEQRCDACIPRQGGIGKAHRIRIDARAVPWRSFRQPHRIAGAAEIVKKAGLVMCFDVQVWPVEDQGSAIVAETGSLRPDHRVYSGGKELALVTPRIKTLRIARIVAKPEIVESGRRPLIDRQGQHIVTKDKVFQHGRPPFIIQTVTLPTGHHKQCHAWNYGFPVLPSGRRERTDGAKKRDGIWVSFGP